MFYCLLLKYTHVFFCCILLLVNTSRFITHIFQDNFVSLEAISTVSVKQFCLICVNKSNEPHYADVIMSAMPSETTEFSIVRSTVCSGADQRKHQRSASLACVCVGGRIHCTGDRWFPSQRASNAKNIFIWWRHSCRKSYNKTTWNVNKTEPCAYCLRCTVCLIPPKPKYKTVCFVVNADVKRPSSGQF